MPFNAFKEEFPLDWFPHAVSTGPAPAGLVSGLQQALLSLIANVTDSAHLPYHRSFQPLRQRDVFPPLSA